MNRQVAKIFYELADFLTIEEVPFKPYAYEKAALILENSDRDIEDIYKAGGQRAIESIPGIGKGMTEKIVEFLKTGKIRYYEDYKKKYPMAMQELTSVEGIGPKMVGKLYKYLKIKNLKELESAAKKGKIRNLPSFGEQTEKNILQGIEFLRRSRKRFLLGEILPRVREIEKALKSLKEVKQISVCGSVRRMKETIGDVDFLITTEKPKIAMDFFCSLPGVVKVWGRGSTKASVRLEQGFDVDIRVVAEKSYGAALQYFTGSREHNIQLRKIAIAQGLKLNEYGLFKGSKMMAGSSEEKVYKKLGLVCPAPEIRENRGEIEAASSGRLPKLVELKHIRGDLHCHSNWDGGENSIEEMTQAAIDRGYQYIGISDHTKFLRIESGLNEAQLAEQRKEIDRLNAGIFSLPNFQTKLGRPGMSKSKFQILQGCEANILNDGSTDIKDESLKKLDYAIAGIHSNMKMPKKEMTERLIKAMKNPYISIIAHPTGRLLKKRDEYQIDIGRILRAARETKTILEINANPARLDLSDIHIKEAVKEGVKLVINTDSHHQDHLRYMEYGIAVARRGWAESADIVNTRPLAKLLNFFNTKG